MTIGRHTRHPEWDERTRGAILYTRDVSIEGMLVGKILRSPHARARILSIDTTEAEKSKGVICILTAGDLPDRSYIDYGARERIALAKTEVSHFGQEVAIVAAETAKQANDALKKIRVQYKVLRPVTDAKAALQKGAPSVRPDRGLSNISDNLHRVFGDMEVAEKSASLKVSGKYEYGIQAHACMEPHAVVASWKVEDGILNVYAPTQSARNLQFEIAHMMGLETEQVRVHSVAVGGDFGARVRACEIEILASHLSHKTGQPVKIELSREEEFAHTKHQHGSSIELETAVDDQGKFLSRKASLIFENGAFIHGSANTMSYCSLLLSSQYRLLAAEIEGKSVYLNRRTGGSFRGAGGPQAVFAMESQIDEIAEHLDLDPIDLRLKNVNHSGDHTITGWEIGSAHVDECIKAVRDKLDWDNSRHLRGSGRGVGIAVAMHVSGAVVSPASCRAEAAIEISHNGAITLFTGSSDPGTGETTLVVQICAHELGIAPEEIAVRVMDTAQTPYDPGAGASKATYVTGNAVRVTAQAVAETLRDEAANILDVNSDEIILKDGYACAGEDKVSFGKAAMSSLKASEQTLRIQREHMAEIPAVALAADQPGYGNLSPSYCFSAQGVELEVDPQTGKINLLKVVAVHDSGVIINPTGARGQVEGGVVMGLGAALGEQLMFQDGRPVITGYGDYAMPLANELPPIEIEFIERKSPRGPYGSKSLAELALMPTAAAVANAVAHATGIRVRSLPITPDKILDKWPNTQDNIKLPSILARPSRWWTEIIRKAYPLGLQSLLHNYGASFAWSKNLDPDIEEIHFPSDSIAAVALLTKELDALPIGGGGDVIVAHNQGLIVAKNLIDLSACSDMAGVDTNPQGDLHIGATVTLAQLASRLGVSDLSGDRAIAETIRKIASSQIRETATIAGNLGQANRCWFFRGGFECYKRGGFTRPCYAVTGDNRYYHAIIDSGRCQSVTPSDLATTLTALDAIVIVKSVAEQRSIPIGNLYSGPAELKLKKGELIFSIIIPAPARRRLTYFEKFSLSEGGFAVVSACVSVDRNNVGIISDARVLLGGVANIPYRSNSVERSMIGTALADLDVNKVSKAWVKQAHPLNGNIWKVKAASGVLRQLLNILHKDKSKELGSKKV